MRNKIRTKFLKFILTTVPIVGQVSESQAGVPYLGITKAGLKCEVKQLASTEVLARTDAGYLTDEDCQTIFVKPPVEGEIEIDHILSPKKMFCAGKNRQLQALNQWNEKAIKGANNDPQFLAKIAEQYQEALEDIYGSDDRTYGGTLSGTLNLRWGRLVEAYRKLNPDKTVRPLPIRIGLFNSQIVSDTGKGGSGQVNSHILRMTTNGLTLRPDSGDADPFLSEIAKKLAAGYKTTIMGQAISTSMDLSLGAICSLDSDKTEQNGKAALFNGTYTYFYPVQTQAFFKINWGPSERLALALTESIQKNGGKLTPEDFTKSIDQYSGYTVTINDGILPGTGEGEKLREEMEGELKELVADQVLSLIASRIDTIINDSTVTSYETRHHTHCRGRWIFKKCRTSSYTVAVQTVDWSSVQTKISSAMSGGSSAGANKYLSFYMMDTSVFKPVARD